MEGDGLAWPIDMAARRGAGLDRALVLGGGGLYFIAWQVGYLHAAARDGLALAAAERIVGTSAGSVVATCVAGGHVGRLHAQLAALSKAPALLSALAPSTRLRPSQQRAVDAFAAATDSEVDTIREIGRRALAAVTVEPGRMRTSLQVAVQAVAWPSDRLHVTCVDAYSGERCVITAGARVRPARAAAASSAVPGLFPPQPIGDRRCMDGGVSGSGLHTDLVAGARRVIVLSLGDARSPAGMTSPAGSVPAELARLEATGTAVLVRSPGEVDREALMSPDAVPDALRAGAALAQADADALRAFWS